jgi:hypothetical protein
VPSVDGGDGSGGDVVVLSLLGGSCLRWKKLSKDAFPRNPNRPGGDAVDRRSWALEECRNVCCCWCCTGVECGKESRWSC